MHDYTEKLHFNGVAAQAKGVVTQTDRGPVSGEAFINNEIGALRKMNTYLDKLLNEGLR
jgi:hypothetical protein